MSSILRRYKDLTEQYRSLSGALDGRRPDSVGVNVPDLSRIQNSILMADEELRQIASLNAQALRVQRKIAGK